MTMSGHEKLMLVVLTAIAAAAVINLWQYFSSG